jgi:RNA polymerase sigma-70 factor (ECF subfamily)
LFRWLKQGRKSDEPVVKSTSQTLAAPGKCADRGLRLWPHVLTVINIRANTCGDHPVELQATGELVGIALQRGDRPGKRGLLTRALGDPSSGAVSSRRPDPCRFTEPCLGHSSPPAGGLELDDGLGKSGRSHDGLVANLSHSWTRRTLLERLAQSGAQNQAAWSEFVDRYGRKIYGWCLRWKLQDADAEDVTQIVLLKLARRMKDFTYDPGRSFRAWLKTVTHHAWQDFVASRRTAPLATCMDAVQERLESVTARDDLARELESLFDLELLETAMQRVRLRAAPHTWMAFSMTVVEGISAAEVARRLAMKIARVYAARNVIQQRLQAECRLLELAQQAW